MSSVELAPSYRPSQVVPSSCGTIRGATAPTAGSRKCGSSRSSHPRRGTQSESRNAIRAVDATASPEFRAAPGPPLTARRTTRAPCSAQIASIAVGSAEQSSTTITCGSPRSPPRHRRSSACRSRTGITTVTSSIPGEPSAPVRSPQSGWAIPASSNRRASFRAARLSPTGAPENQPATARAPAGVSRSTRTGDPPTSTASPATNRVPESALSRNPAGASSSAGPAGVILGWVPMPERSGGRSGVPKRCSAPPSGAD